VLLDNELWCLDKASVTLNVPRMVCRVPMYQSVIPCFKY